LGGTRSSPSKDTGGDLNVSKDTALNQLPRQNEETFNVGGAEGGQWVQEFGEIK
jgi:hypothetical protein